MAWLPPVIYIPTHSQLAEKIYEFLDEKISNLF